MQMESESLASPPHPTAANRARMRSARRTMVRRRAWAVWFPGTRADLTRGLAAVRREEVEALMVPGDPDLFIGLAQQSRHVMRDAVCRECPVREERRAYAVEHELSGIWGGTSVRKRRRLRNRRAA
jgi:hypothetical protein